MRLKTLGFAALCFCLLLTPEKGTAQEITGTVRANNSTINFEEFGSENKRFNGEIRSNLLGSKYTFHLKNGQEELEGEIMDKLSQFNVDLTYKGNTIEGQIKQSPNNTKDEWDIQFLGHKLTGRVVHNAMGTADTYDLSYNNKKITGKIHKNINTLAYDLQFGEKKVSGKMSYNISTVKHTYNLKAEELTDDEFLVLVFIESIKLMNELITDIEEFQSND